MRPGAVPHSSPTPPPAVPTPPPTWATASEPAGGFTIQYPPGWAPKAPATGGPDHAYFATQDAPAPLEMSQSDVWLTVQVQEGQTACDPKLPGDDGGSVPALLAGKSARLELRNPPRGASEPTWKAYAVAPDGTRCYVLWFVTLNPQTRAAALPTMLQILAGFTATPAPAPSPSPATSPTATPSPSPSPVSQSSN
ncbi:MAG TPA: hypothetical protein VF137_07925 [Candidatus Dormibacteraeota bacterium]